MPRNYSYSLWSWPAISHLISLPIQPTVVVSHGPVKVYARPGHVLLSEKDFWATLRKYNGIHWPDDPDSPDYLTWKDWRLNLKQAIEEACCLKPKEHPK